ncbi:AAA family ATPase [Kamptonema animale CS-326]|jgi:predicted ATPase|uniref:AAA family ATPase n=1 Tax=Kamptonema animale TaxID=92934 RepID=UPI00232E1A64|nr:AAA family ATPase [Kamptonema animale]MDB9514496.1 AAA family ATPase [Kamptonema animale CS-326]
MDSIRVERLRCLGDTGHIQLKPITVLLGQNSSGKSSFLRILPLLKQSVELRTIEPILWFGRLVDFGNFDDAHQTGGEGSIAFSFNFKLESSNYGINTDFVDLIFSEGAKILNTLNITLSLQVSKYKNKEATRTSKIFLQIEDSKIELEFGEDDYLTKFWVNSFNVLNVLNLGDKYFSSKFNINFLLPTITEKEQKKEYEFNKSFLYSQILNTYVFRLPALFKALTDKIEETIHPKTKLENIIKMVLSFGLGNSENMLKDIQQNTFAGKSWKSKTQEWTIETKEFKELRDIIIAFAISFIIEKCDEILANFSKNISYIGPVRATAVRYYRYQGLAVDEVDSQGNNLAMFLRNLNQSQMQSFSAWTLDNFGFNPSIKSSIDHISLTICSKDSDKDLNIADTGFGFSQILPVITQLWLLSSSNRGNRGTITYAIEQPELHLHPRLQGTLTDALVKSITAAKDNDIDLRLMIETHSEVLVNRLGQLIAEGKISPDEINIVLFEPSDKLGEVTIRNVQFDSDGYLLNWPLGFFEMELV